MYIYINFLRLLNIVVPWDDLKEEYESEYRKIKSNYSRYRDNGLDDTG